MKIETFDDFKMERFKQIPSKIADQVRLDRTPTPLRKALLQEQREHDKDPKYHIKKNMKTIHQINSEVQQNIKAQELEDKRKQLAVSQIGHGKIPKSVQNIIYEQQREREATYLFISLIIYRLKEIELNKRPAGTKILEEDERKQMLRGLKKEKKNLQNQMERMSVTQYTTRAQNQYKNFGEKLDDIDSSLKVLERKKFIYVS